MEDEVKESIMEVTENNSQPKDPVIPADTRHSQSTCDKERCPDCGQPTFRSGNCPTCPWCGWSKCP